MPPRVLVGVLLLLLLLTLLWVVYPGTDDLASFFLPWSHNLLQHGLVAGYTANHGDYPPGTSIVLALTARLAQAATGDAHAALKWSLVLVLLASSAMVGAWTRSWAGAAVFHAALLYPTVALGYLDIYFAPLLLGALWAVQRGRHVAAGILLGCACLTKWQPLLVVPFALIYLWKRERTAPVRLVRVLIPPALLGVATVGLYGDAVVDAFHEATHHHFLSGNALNFCWLITHWLRVYRPERFGGLIDGQANFIETRALAYTLLPRVVFVVTYGGALALALRQAATVPNLLRCSLVGAMAYFTFNPGVHENHLLLAVMLSVTLAATCAAAWPVAIGICLLSDVNLFLFYGIDGTGFHYPRLILGVDSALLVALATVGCFPVVVAYAVRGVTPQPAIAASVPR